MDGTLLGPDQRIPEAFWPLLQHLDALGVAFAPASGRQLATLRRQFERADAQLGVQLGMIAENGTVVFHDGEVVATTTIPAQAVHPIIDAVNQASGVDWGLVVCRPNGAWVQRRDDAFFEQCRIYYAQLDHTEDLHEIVSDDVVKLAVFCFGDAEHEAAWRLREVAGGLDVLVSGAHWVDLMSPQASKGRALAHLADALNVPMERTIAFGDYLNDLDLLRAAGTAYAMDNAHPDIKAIANAIAPSNAEAGVLTVLEALREQLESEPLPPASAPALWKPPSSSSESPG